MSTHEDSTRRQILGLLKRRGELTATKLAEVIGITSMGVRQHLSALERDGFVATALVRQKRGRPTHVYRLTDAAEEFFPVRYGQVTVELLDHLVQIDGPAKVDQLFARRMDTLERAYKRTMNDRDLVSKVVELARIRDDEGYMAEVEHAADEEYMLVEHHCPIYEIAKRYPQACQYELELFSRTLGVEVRRVEHKIMGGGRCRYAIVKNMKKL